MTPHTKPRVLLMNGPTEVPQSYVNELKTLVDFYVGDKYLLLDLLLNASFIALTYLLCIRCPNHNTRPFNKPLTTSLPNESPTP